MYPALTLIVGLCAALAVALATRALGRLAGLSTAALCGASIVFFAMEPVFSFAIDSPFDRVTLLLYGVASLFAVHRAPGRKPTAFPPPIEPGKARPESSPAVALDEMIQAALARSGQDGIAVDIDPRMRFRCLSGEVRSLLIGILELALMEVAPLRIMTYSAEMPEQNRIWIALQYKRAPDEPHSMIIGRRGDRCTAVDTGDHPGCDVTSFDNGFERVLQISLRRYVR